MNLGSTIHSDSILLYKENRIRHQASSRKYPKLPLDAPRIELSTRDPHSPRSIVVTPRHLLYFPL
jgi:hypothetical protein